MKLDSILLQLYSISIHKTSISMLKSQTELKSTINSMLNLIMSSCTFRKLFTTINGRVYVLRTVRILGTRIDEDNASAQRLLLLSFAFGTLCSWAKHCHCGDTNSASQTFYATRRRLPTTETKEVRRIIVNASLAGNLHNCWKALWVVSQSKLKWTVDQRK